MAFHATHEYDLITLNQATPPKNWEDDFQNTANARPRPFKDDLPLWRNSTPAGADYNTTESCDVSAMKSIHETLCRVERGLASVEKRMNARDKRLYETVDELGTKFELIELSQAKRDEEFAQIRRELRAPHDKIAGLRDVTTEKYLVPQETFVRHEPNRNTDSPAVTPAEQSNCGHPSKDNGEDELWTSLEKIHKLVRETQSGASGPAHRTSLNPEAKPHIKPSPYDGSSSWDDYRA